MVHAGFGAVKGTRNLLGVLEHTPPRTRERTVFRGVTEMHFNNGHVRLRL